MDFNSRRVRGKHLFPTDWSFVTPWRMAAEDQNNQMQVDGEIIGNIPADGESLVKAFDSFADAKGGTV